MSVRSTAILALLAIGLCVPARALETDRSLRQLHHAGWARADGAPSQISALAQTSDGFLWIGSTQGLFRFDGMQFERFEPRNGEHVPSHNTYALHPVADGGLWVSFRPSGLGYIRDGNLTLYTQPGKVPATQVYAFATARDGRLFAGTHQGIAQWDGTRWRDLDAAWGLPSERVRRMLALPRGLAVMVGDSVWLLPPNATRFTKLADIPAIPIEMAADPGGTLWVTTYDGTLRIPPKGEPIFADLKDGRATLELIFDRDGALWLGNDEGLRRVRDPGSLASMDGTTLAKASDTFRVTDGLTADMVVHMLEDREGNVWVATARGIDRFRSNPVVPFVLPESLSSSTIAAGERGGVWVAGVVSDALVLVEAEHRSRDDPARPAGTRQFLGRSVARDRHGNLWWGGVGALYLQRGERVDVVQGPAGLRSEMFWDVIPAPGDDGLWVGIGDDGVWHYLEGRWARADLPRGMLGRVPSASFDDGAGVRWFGYTENRVHVVHHGRVTAYGPGDGLDVGRVKVIRGNAVQRWVGGELGVALFDGKRFHRIRFAGDPQPGAVGGIVPTRSGDVWLSEMHGLIRIPADEVRMLLRDPRHVVRAERFDEADGVPGAPQMNTTSSTALEASDGVLWFVTDSGLAWVDPTKLQTPRPNPRVRLLGVRPEGNRTERNPPFAFPVGTDRIEFAFAAMTLTAPERVRFRYKLEGFDKRWQDAGTKREVAYSHIPPGDYTFRVLAAHPGRPWRGEETAVPVSIAPAFWQTRWFLVSCLVAGVTVLAGLYLLRVQRMERQMHARLQERHGERERIARELHDTLLQGIHGLILRFHAIALQIPNDRPVRAEMETALDRADEMLVESRDRVTNLRTSGEPVTSLPIALAQAGQHLAESFHGQFVHAVQGVERTIDPIVQDDIYQLGREALLNAFNHSGGSRIELLMVFDHHRFVLRVIDNGRGLDPGLATGGLLPGHWGLAGMRERAERVGGSLSIGPGADGGTAIELTVPARTAFAVSAARRFRDWAVRRATMKART